MDGICLVTLIGLPAAGKTSMCNKLMHMKTLPFNILHLCYDNYIKFNSEYPNQYKQQRDNLLNSLRTIINNFKTTNTWPKELNFLKSHCKNHHQKGFVILCDDNHYYVSMRYKLCQLAREHNIGYCQVYFKTSIEIAIEHNNLRFNANKVPNDVIIQMSKRLEVPNDLVNKWEENTLSLQNPNLNNADVKNIISFIMRALDKPLQPLQLPCSKSPAPQSKVHDLDLMMRKRINNLMSCEQGENKKLLAKNLNYKRKDILKKFQMEEAKKLPNDIDLNKYVEMLN
ncbi:phosphoseryl tRNA kinase [Cochliomyia hominivorax]